MFLFTRFYGITLYIIYKIKTNVNSIKYNKQCVIVFFKFFNKFPFFFEDDANKFFTRPLENIDPKEIYQKHRHGD